MAKQGGMGDNLYIDGYDLSGDTNSLGRIGGGPAPWDVTGINKSAFERIGLKIDGGIDWTAYFNPATGQAHARLSSLPLTDRIISYYRGTAIGSPAANLVGKQVNYDPTRGADGSLTIGLNAQANGYGIEWGEQLTAGKRTDTTATDGTSLDGGAATAFGLAAYLHVFAFTGTSVTVTLEDSADDSTFAAITDAEFTAATGITSQRIQIDPDADVRRYVRAATSGTFTNAVFAVSFVRYATTPLVSA